MKPCKNCFVKEGLFTFIVWCEECEPKRIAELENTVMLITPDQLEEVEGIKIKPLPRKKKD